MRLTESLTTIFTAALLAVTLAGCAGGSPKRPTAAADNSAKSSGFEDRCNDAYQRNAFPPPGCPDVFEPRRSRARTLPPAPALQLPRGPLQNGSVLGR